MTDHSVSFGLFFFSTIILSLVVMSDNIDLGMMEFPD